MNVVCYPTFFNRINYKIHEIPTPINTFDNMMYPTIIPYTHSTPGIENSIEMVSVSIGAYQEPQYAQQDPNKFDPFQNPVYPPEHQQVQSQQGQSQQVNQSGGCLSSCCHLFSICTLISCCVPFFTGVLQGISSCFTGVVIGFRSCSNR